MRVKYPPLPFSGERAGVRGEDAEAPLPLVTLAPPLFSYLIEDLTAPERV